MKLKSFVSILSIAAVALSLSACKSAAVKQNTDHAFPIVVSAEEPAFIFPISLHGTPGNDTEVGLAISSGAVAEYGASVISGQQLYSQVGNLSWTLGENMRRQANKDQFKMTGTADKEAKKLDKQMKKLTSKLKSMGVITNPDYNFKYVIVLHVDSAGGMQVPYVKNVTAFGGIIDLETQEIVTYIEKDLTLSEDGVLAQMPAEMNKIIADLLAPSA